ncbi:cell surface protein [Streptomyces sp. SKN60]|uniref:cell surface protein n=1 Tax=Streptomyces sp. SKN60 TaxID=2855506 RepID=UPI002245D40E|nr:cell surface protein [Streptomyces sp. SKN60]
MQLAGFGSAEGRVPIPEVSAGGSTCFTVDTTRPGLHRVLVETDPHIMRAVMLDGTTAVTCIDGDSFGEVMSCPLPRAGSYTLRLTNYSSDPAHGFVSVFPLATTDGCAPETGTSWDLPPITGVVEHSLEAVCHPFAARPGERVQTNFAGSGIDYQWITDETGADICDRRSSSGCVLPGDGPYRVIGHTRPWNTAYPHTYELTVRRYSDPVPCATVPIGSYGSAPSQQDPPAPCKTFSVPAAGAYSIMLARDAFTDSSVYDRAGERRCGKEEYCSLAAPGPYTVFTNKPLLVLDATATEGCTPAVFGANTGSFAALGERDCFLLPYPAGAKIAAIADIAQPYVSRVMVVDANGASVCDDYRNSGACTLTGQAPFRVLVDAQDTSYATASPYPGGSYTVRLYRLDGPNTCAVLPSGDFTPTSPAVLLDLTAQTSHCLRIPAADHAAKEIFQTVRTTDGWNSTLAYTVFDEQGREVCARGRQYDGWQVCALAPGVAHTVIAVGNGGHIVYDLSRKDITATARGCESTPATAAGGPSYESTPAPQGVLRCRQVTAADAGDVIHLNVRDGLDNVTHAAYRPDGSTACYPSRSACSPRGSTRYQVVFAGDRYGAVKPTAYHFDAVRVATSAGPAPECAKAVNVSYGYGPVTGVLDEQHSTTCAALPTFAGDTFEARISDTVRGYYPPIPSLIGLAGGASCEDMRPGYTCSVGGTAGTAQPTVLILGMPERAADSTYSAELVCTRNVCGADKVSFTDVAPRAGASDTMALVTMTGTALKADHKVRIEHPSGARVEGRTVSVAADRRSLVAEFDLTGAPVGIWTLSAVDGEKVFPLGSFTVVKTSAAGLGSFKALTPARLMDTRSGLGVPKGRVGPGGTVTLPVTGRQGIPSAGVSAVVLNVTATGPTAGSFVSVYPSGTARASASNLNFTAGQTIPNLVVVPVGADGKVAFYNKNGSVDLIADVAGYYVTDGSGATYQPVTPNRLMDTRSGLGVAKAKVGAGQSVDLQVTGKGGVPASGVTAVVMNVTATGPTAGSFVSVYPSGTARTSASNLNFTAGQTIPNLVVVPVGADGKVTFYNKNGSVDLIADVAGYFTMDATGSAYKPMAPTRLMDTRSGLGVPKAKVGPDGTVTLVVAGQGGIPATGVTAVVMNVTAVAPTAGSFVAVFPDGTQRTSASNLNFTAGTTIPNLVVVPVVNGKVSFYNKNGSVDLLADVAGYYVS